jgi:5-formyltetrahydrofolate cyclo-ligase
MGLRKELIRKDYLNLRKLKPSFYSFLLSWEIQNKFLNSDIYRKSNIIGVYYPILNEVQSFRIITKGISDSKTIALPIVANHTLSFHKYFSLQSLKMGPYKIKEPAISDVAMDDKLDTIIVPGIAFDRRGYRVGYGKGYYDKFFGAKKRADLNIIGLAFDFQLLDDYVEVDCYDIKLKKLYTEKRILEF